MTIENKVEEIISLYLKYGDSDYIGEPVSQIEHMYQCAELAMEANANEELILAAFFHDIGHLYEFAFPDERLISMDGFGIFDHERIGANYLASMGFSDTISKLVASHVQAKRYLAYKFPSYLKELSEASLKTLVFQGGKMSEEEASEFENDKLFEQYITLRIWDEKAKLTNKATGDLKILKELMINHLKKINQAK